MATKNIVTDYGAVADGSYAIAVLTITSGSNVLHSASNIWSSGDIGKHICVGSAGGGGPGGGTPLITTISGFTSVNQITLGANAAAAIAGESTVLSWGTTNNLTKFKNFASDFAGQTVTLTIPPGVYFYSSGNDSPFTGISNLTVNGTGAVLAGETIVYGGGAETVGTTRSARFNSVAAGSRSIVLDPTSDDSKFLVGDTILLTGIDMQQQGYPTNHAFFEYRTILSISSGVITFTEPLLNSYVSTWPNYSTTGLDYGGPGTAYKFTDGWDATYVYNGLTFATHAETKSEVKSVTFNNCTSLGPFGVFPSSARDFTINNGNWSSCTMEVDKYIDTLTFSNTTVGVVNIQSSTVNNLNINNGSQVALLLGTPRNSNLKDSTFTAGIIPGPNTYGYNSGTLIADTCVIPDANLVTGGYVVQDGGDFSARGIDVDGTMTNGIISIPTALSLNYPVTRWAIPGSVIFWQDSVGHGYPPFKILDVKLNGSNTDIYTDQTGGFPDLVTTGHLWVYPHPCKSVTFRNCSSTAPAGHDDGSFVYGLSRATAGNPLWSYSYRTYTGSTPTPTGSHYLGLFKSIKIDVVTPYTGPTVGAVTFSPMFMTTIRQSDHTEQNIQPIVNLKVGGLRTITPGSFSGDASDTGLSIPASWFYGAPAGAMTNISGENPSGWPVVTVEVITDQGYPQPRTLPTKMVLH